MAAIAHHTPDSLLAAYAAGSLPTPFALVVATHVSMCLECRAGYEAHHVVGGAMLESTGIADLSRSLKANVLALLDAHIAPESVYARSGVYPAPVMQALKGMAPRRNSLGTGVRQSILCVKSEGSVRLLDIPPGQAVSDHSHNGLELTLVLHRRFRDETGRFGLGDIEIADENLEHAPFADVGAPCICLAATDAPLKFKSLSPRLLQSLFQI